MARQNFSDFAAVKPGHRVALPVGALLYCQDSSSGQVRAGAIRAGRRVLDASGSSVDQMQIVERALPW
jgi:hypothetical protein